MDNSEEITLKTTLWLVVGEEEIPGQRKKTECLGTKYLPMNICIRNRPLTKITNVLRKTIHFGDTVTSMPHRPHLWQNSWGKRPYLKESIIVGSSVPTGAEGMGMPRRNRSSL